MFIFLMALYFIANTACRLLLRVFTQKTKLDPYAASFAIVISTYVFGCIYGVARLEQSLLQGVTPLLALVVFVVGIMQIVAGKVAVVTQKNIETARYSVMRMLQVPCSVLIATVFLNEGLNLLRLLGMASILVGVSIVSTDGKIPRIKHFGRYELLTLSNSLFMGAYVIVSKLLIAQTSLSTLLVVFGFLEMIPLVFIVATQPIKAPSKTDVGLSIGIGLTAIINIVAFWLAVELSGNVSLVSSLSAFRIVTIFFGSYLLLKEKDNLKQKLVGSSLAVLGLLLSQ